MSNVNDLRVLSNWLEEKLKEYFVKKLQLRQTKWKLFSLGESDFKSFFVPNGVLPIQTTVSDFRILDFKLQENANKNQKIKPGPSFDEEVTIDALLQPSDPTPIFSAREKSHETKEPYQTQNSRVQLVYQETSHSVATELQLYIQASQIDDLRELQELYPKYELSLDEHQIDVYTRVLPFLKHWASYKRIPVDLHVPECYYGSYVTETNTKETTSGEGADNDTPDDIPDPEPLFADDILSKVGAGLEFYVKEKQKRAKNAGKQSSYRLLILEDVSRQNFKLRNVRASSTFLSLLNIEEALKSLAEIHCISWVYSQVSGKSLVKTWPFLNNPLYLPYIQERVIPGFSAMERLVQSYIFCSGKETQEDGTRLLKSLANLGPHLQDILEGAKHPRCIKCLVHQSACFSNFLFKYSVLKIEENKMKRCREKAEQSIKNKNNIDLNAHYPNNNLMEDGGNDNKNNSNKARSSMADFSSEVKSNRDENEVGAFQQAVREGLTKELSRKVMVINWRTAAVGSPMIDVAFLLLTALPPKTRRAETAALLRIYWSSFRMLADKFGLSLTWSDKELYQDYLGALLYSCVLITGNITSSHCELDDDGMEVFLEAIKDLIRENVI